MYLHSLVLLVAVVAAIFAGRAALDAPTESLQTAETAAESASISSAVSNNPSILNDLNPPISLPDASILKDLSGSASSAVELGSRFGRTSSELTAGSLWQVTTAITNQALMPPLPPEEILRRVVTDEEASQPAGVYIVYSVQSGDTVGSIASRFQISAETLLWNNPELKDDPNFLKPEQQLVVPSGDGMVYYVRLGDTVEGIAGKFGIDPQSIVAYTRNNLADASSLAEGVEILLPGAYPISSRPENLVAQPTPAPALSIADTAAPAVPVPPATPGYAGDLWVGASVRVLGPDCLNSRPAPGGNIANDCLPPGYVSSIVAGPVAANGYWWWKLSGLGWSVDDYLQLNNGQAPAAPAPVSVSGLIWPVTGRITDGFGVPRGGNTYHTGVDIDVPDGSHSAVVAAAGGQVIAVVAGYGGGFGTHVIISHGNGLETVYAHLSSAAVSLGQYVSQGQVIGYTGCSGLCFGEHLHFEMHLNGALVNPLNYLP